MELSDADLYVSRAGWDDQSSASQDAGDAARSSGTALRRDLHATFLTNKGDDGSVDISVDSEDHGGDQMSELDMSSLPSFPGSHRPRPLHVPSTTSSTASFSVRSPSRRSSVASSYGATMSAWDRVHQADNVPPRSAAVISAMGALQDKIRSLEKSLEQERERNLALRTEAETARQSFEAKAKTMHAENDELASKVRMLEQAKRQACHHAEEYRSKLAEITASMEAAQAENNALAQQSAETEGKLAEASAEHTRATEEATRAAGDLRAQIDLKEARVKSLQEELVAVDSQKIEAQAAIRNLLLLNEDLMNKLARRGARKSRGWSLDKELLHANADHPVPFLLGKNAGPSFSVYGRVQEELADPWAYGIPSPRERAGRRAQRDARGFFQEEEVGQDSEDDRYDDEENEDENDNSDEEDEVKGETDRKQDEGGRGGIKNRPNESKAVELDTLQRQYQILVTEISSSVPGPGSVAESNSSELFKQTGLRKSRDLTEVVEKIEIKTQQLAALEGLRRSAAVSPRPRSPVRSPEAFDRKVQALRTLQHFREEPPYL
ncbi:Hypothetical Protein FCC1311_082932 [Hondaea fermentalgiana]|uniref:Uncharacterized protein n=1 Tax=Hondaea fermentalgiana TaxID=2315210 RepID=A0A2R5GQN3_9STRA|nr:Hypothetical Protein FCC1311_082932 [Hondaea fermentalgiana]|eukprot:GBG32068.1 Hypothetical Protein FCC1311_082932 [Hondaea fermentalgiana]